MVPVGGRMFDLMFFYIMFNPVLSLVLSCLIPNSQFIQVTHFDFCSYLLR